MAFWQKNYNDNLNATEIFYYYKFLRKNKIIYEESEKHIFVGKRNIKNNRRIFMYELDKLKLTINVSETKLINLCTTCIC